MTIEIFRDTERFQPAYDLTTEDAHKLCVDYLAQWEEQLDDEERDLWPKYGCYLVDGSDAASNMGRYVESKAKLDSFGVSPKQLETEYGEYEQASDFLIVIDHEKREPIAVLRTIDHDEDGLEPKTLRDIEAATGIAPKQLYRALDTSQDRILEVGALAVLPEARSPETKSSPPTDEDLEQQVHGRPLLLLFRALNHKLSSNPGISHIVGITNTQVEASIDRLKIPFRPMLGMESFSYGNKSDGADNSNSLARGIFIPVSEISPQLNYWQELYKTQSGILMNYSDLLESDGDQESSKDAKLRADKIAKLGMEIGALIDPLRRNEDLDGMLHPDVTKSSGFTLSRPWLESSNAPEVDIEEAELWRRFSSQRLREMSTDFITSGPHGDIRERVRKSGKKYMTAVISATDARFMDLGKAPETIVFASRFERSLKEVHDEYAVHDQNSEFIVAFDVRDPDYPVPAGAIRMIHGKTINDLKSIKDLVADTSENPWLEEIKKTYFTPGESYDPNTAWERLCSQAGVSLNPKESSDVATLSVFESHGRHGSLNGASVLLYHSCAKYAISKGKKNLISIQDAEPFDRLQKFGQPFDEFYGLKPHPYGGPYDTKPAYCVISEGIPRVRRNNEFMASILVDGLGISKYALLLQDLAPETYGKKRRTTAKFLVQAMINRHKSSSR